MGIILTALSLFLMVIGSHAIGGEVKLTITSDFKTLLDAQWKNIEPVVPIRPGEDPGLGVFWRYRISPPFPSHWPSDGSLQLIYYVYAAGLSPRRLVDGEYVAASWGRVEVDPRASGGPKFMRLSEKLRELGIQGVRPLTQEETAIFQKEAVAEAYLATLTSLTDKNEKDVRMLRQYFCTWCQFNGHIVREIRPAHEEFFLWLGCK